MRSTLLCDITQLIAVIPYWHFEKTYRSHAEASKIQEDPRRAQLHQDGLGKAKKSQFVIVHDDNDDD
jgi:hypothetical protein